jgi:hypothetical protein
MNDPGKPLTTQKRREWIANDGQDRQQRTNDAHGSPTMPVARPTMCRIANDVQDR